jgi:hypothetical protein
MGLWFEVLHRSENASHFEWQLPKSYFLISLDFLSYCPNRS